jgi:hypothetical protein
MLNKLRVFALICASVALLPLPASAQFERIPAVDISGGYSWVYTQSLPLDSFSNLSFLRNNPYLENSVDFPKGFYVSFAPTVGKSFAIATELSANESKQMLPDVFNVPGSEMQMRDVAFMAGPRVTIRAEQGTFYTQFLTGADFYRTTHNGTTDSMGLFGFQAGAGADVMFSPMFGVRAGGNWKMVHWDDGWRYGIQVQVGLVIAAGER